jgi:hypothetical protein
VKGSGQTTTEEATIETVKSNLIRMIVIDRPKEGAMVKVTANDTFGRIA